MRLPRSLAGRITLTAVAVVGVALLVAGIAVVLASARSDRDALDRELERIVSIRRGPALRAIGGPPPGGSFGGVRRRDGVRRGAGGPPFPGRGGEPLGPAPEPAAPLDPGNDRFVRAITPSGSSTSAGATVPEDFPVTEPDKPTTVEADGEDWRTLTRALPGGATLQVAAELQPLQAREARLRRIVLIVAGAALLITALAAGALARASVAPLGRLRDAAGQVTETADLGVRVPDEGPEEVQELAGDLNAMLGRLEVSASDREAALEAARRFAADAGHELRTPLTSLRANLSALGSSVAEDPPARRALQAAQGDAVRLAGLVEQLQALARGEAGPPAAAEPVDVGELVDAAVAALRTRHPEVTAQLEAPEEGPSVRGDAEGLRILVDNLLENAARHGRPGGRIAAEVARENGGARLTIDDDGPGIPPQERTAVLERFARGRDARGPGSGLGLAIAAAQAHRHGGDLHLDGSPLGGLRVVATLPGS
jgi:two-component system, OmpR family, sensor histidine kinase PrrB